VIWDQFMPVRDVRKVSGQPGSECQLNRVLEQAAMAGDFVPRFGLEFRLIF